MPNTTRNDIQQAIAASIDVISESLKVNGYDTNSITDYLVNYLAANIDDITDDYIQRQHQNDDDDEN